MTEPIKEPNLVASLLSDDPRVRLLAIGEVLWQAQAFARSIAMAQVQATKHLPTDISDEAKKSLAAVQRVAENTVCWLDEHCKRVYAQTSSKTNDAPAAEEKKSFH